MEKLVKEIWEKKALESGYDPVLIQAYGERLSQAIDKGYQVSEDFSTPDQKKIHALKKNVWQFSSAKSYTQLKQLSEALVKPDGTVRPFDEFRIQASIITGEQLRHLKTEYNTAVAGAQMASKWEEIKRMKASYPLLEFIAIEDNHTSALCRSLNGVIRPVDDPLWAQFYPPNHYNCRSTVKQLRKGEITPDDKIVRPNIPKIFKVNLGERGLAFPEDHAYFDGMPADVAHESRKHFPYNMQFDIMDISEETLGIVRRHFMVDTKASDYERNYNIAVSKAKTEKIIIDLMPTLDPNSYVTQRAVIFPDAKFRKSPDLRINKVLWEEESIDLGKPLTQENISRKLSKGIKQAERVIMSLYDEVSEEILSRVAEGKFDATKSLEIIEFRTPTKSIIYKRQKPLE